MLKPRVIILLNFLAVASLLQITARGPSGSHNHMFVAYGRPFTVVSRHWTCDWQKGWGLAEEVEYGVSFAVTSLLMNAAIIIAIGLAAYFVWRKAGPGGPAWSRMACLAYVLATLVLLTINVWFAVAHRTDTETMRTGVHSVGWPVPSWSNGIIKYADVYNGLIMLTVPLLVSIVSEKVVRCHNMRHNQRMHQTPDGAGDP